VCHTCLKKPLNNFPRKRWKLKKMMKQPSNHLLRISLHPQ
jgi:hypothetical protein